MHMLRILLLPALVLAAHVATAQCPGCNPDVTCTVSPAYPTLCPLAPPDATAGEYYETDITFWLPPTFTDPGTGFTVNFQQMTITNVSGLPFGLNITYNNPSGVYYPQQEEYGCARICGTPLGAGVYTITISIIAGVEFSGIPINSPQEFALSLTVLPGSGGNAGFTFTPASGCGSAAVQFEALIDGSPSPTSYAWDFGNGGSGASATPPVQTYDEPGEYIITLQTTIGGYVLQEVTLTGVNGNWCGDVEEPNVPLLGCQGSPDPYFVLTDAQGGTYTSSTVDDSFTATWTGLGLLLENPPYSISFYDEDVISQNDLLGTYNIPANGAGTYNINVASGTTGSLVVIEQAQDVFTHTDTVHVFALPEVVLVENAQTGELCVEDTALVGYVWFLDGDTVPGLSGPCIVPTGPGVWRVVGTNGYGCAAQGGPIIVCPTITITRTGGVLQVPSGFASYAWTYQGSAVGGNEAFLITAGDGTYTCTVTDVNGCTVTASFELSTIGVEEAGGTTGGLMVFPVPNDGRFNVVAEGFATPMVQLRILDAAGREVRSLALPTVQGALRIVIDERLAPGSYLLQAVDGLRTRAARFIVR